MIVEFDKERSLTVKVFRSPGRRIVMVNGEPLVGKAAAAALNLPYKCYDKRLERKTKLTKPLQIKCRPRPV